MFKVWPYRSFNLSIIQVLEDCAKHNLQIFDPVLFGLTELVGNEVQYLFVKKTPQINSHGKTEAACPWSLIKLSFYTLTRFKPLILR